MSAEQKTPNGAAPAPTIEQVRELLFGQEQRTIEGQLAEIRTEMQQMRSELEKSIKDLKSELNSALSKTDAEHKERFAKVGQAIQQVGRDIGGLSGS